MAKIKSRKLKESSRKWVARQLDDPYVKQAKAEGFRARSAYKIKEIQQKHKIFKKNMSIIDLGCAPGSWLQMIHSMMEGEINLIGIDLLPIEPLPYAHIIQGDVTDEKDFQLLMQSLQEKKCNGVISDMAAYTTGHKKTDQLRTLYLAECAFDIAMKSLDIDGFFLCKVFQGGANGIFLEELKKNFCKIKHIKPLSSRKESPEVYMLATGYRSI